MRREAQFKKWFFEAISLVVIQSFRERRLCLVAIFGGHHFLCKQCMRLGCNHSKTDLALHTDLPFWHRALINTCPDCTPKILCTSAQLFNEHMGGSFGTSKIFGTSTQLCLGLIHLHRDKWQCHTPKLSVWCQNFGVPC